MEQVLEVRGIMDNPWFRLNDSSAVYLYWAFFDTWVEMVSQGFLLVWPSWRLEQTINWVFLLTCLNREVRSEWWPSLLVKYRCGFGQNWVFNVITRRHQCAERTPTLLVALDFHIFSSCLLLGVLRNYSLLVNYLSLKVELFIWCLSCQWFLRGTQGTFM